ncbi:hypothetical protein [Bradyrhizobium sp. ORS 285]|uniref:hypothetical protein n=1 Tax=Bradyrhizobium sp. ORS 285 TaxID=115808 RepID=UPI0005536927|nr:hypothetical protein [Bradyrhizobium sp. ORS 285]
MAWANWISAGGNVIEIIGFAILAKELWGTNTSAIIENEELRAMPSDFETISIYDGEGGGPKGGFIGGGRIENLISNLNRRQRELTQSKRLILYDLAWTCAGIVLQTVGSIGQALNP